MRKNKTRKGNDIGNGWVRRNDIDVTEVLTSVRIIFAN
jgi:hypothetical protein